MCPNFDVRYQIESNPKNILMAIFVDLRPCLFTTNSAKLSCASEVTLMQGHHGRQGSQSLVLGWILRNRKRQQQWRRAGEVADTMASLPAKNLPWWPCNVLTTVGFQPSLTQCSKTVVTWQQKLKEAYP